MFVILELKFGRVSKSIPMNFEGAGMKNRPGAYRKVRAVQEAMKRKAKMLRLG